MTLEQRILTQQGMGQYHLYQQRYYFFDHIFQHIWWDNTIKTLKIASKIPNPNQQRYQRFSKGIHQDRWFTTSIQRTKGNCI